MLVRNYGGCHYSIFFFNSLVGITRSQLQGWSEFKIYDNGNILKLPIYKYFCRLLSSPVFKN